MKCRMCNEEINVLPSIWDINYIPTEEDKTTKGNVYSCRGFDEVKISGFCEVCFDSLFKEEDEDDISDDKEAS